MKILENQEHGMDGPNIIIERSLTNARERPALSSTVETAIDESDLAL